MIKTIFRAIIKEKYILYSYNFTEIEKKEINIEFLKQNKEYQEYKQIISNEIEKYKEQIREVEEKIKYITHLFFLISMQPIPHASGVWQK